MNFMRDVIRMNWNGFNIHEWEKEKCEELVRLESERVDRERREALEEEIKKMSVELKEVDRQLKDADKQLKDAKEREKISKLERINTVKNMLKKNFSLEDIQDIIGNSMEEIKQVKKDLENDI